MTNPKIINTPLTGEVAQTLRTGDLVHISGQIYTARDAAHHRLVKMVEAHEKLPFDFEGQIVYYAGPCPTPPGLIIGSVGPTTSGRMDAYTPTLIGQGLKYMIGKGLRNEAVKKTMLQHQGVYFAAIGGAAALMSQCITQVETIAFENLGPEAIRRLTVKNFPAVVGIDTLGQDIYDYGSR